MHQGAYGVQVTIERPLTSNRFWAIPILGYLVKGIILIPHMIVLYALMMVVSILQLILWIPVLFGGRYPDYGFTLVGGSIRWSTRLSAYFLGLTDSYPPFELGSGQPYPVQVEFAHPESSNRFWAIPIVGYVVKSIILIPHLIVLSILMLVVNVLQLVTWIPVLFGGRYPDWGMSLVGGTLRWSATVMAYFYGLTDEYPPFEMSPEAQGTLPRSATA